MTLCGFLEQVTGVTLKKIKCVVFSCQLGTRELCINYEFIVSVKNHKIYCITFCDSAAFTSTVVAPNQNDDDEIVYTL